MQLRFVQGTSYISRWIVDQEKAAMPFTPSHVEAVMPNGTWLGAHIDVGVQARPAGYDKGEVAHELFLTLPALPAQDAAFHTFLEKHIGEPYDWSAILGFVLPQHEHAPEHAICSALCTLGLRTPTGVPAVSPWFPWPLAAPAHLISPRDLLVLISGRLEIPMFAVPGQPGWTTEPLAAA
jgi:hypothetical protein